MKISVIITADDLGYCTERDDGILQAFQRGIVTNASLLVTGISAESAGKRAKCLSLPLGLHLNLTEGSPLAIGPCGSSLCDESLGEMLGKFGLRKRLAEDQISLIDVEKEIQAQIDRFREITGYEPTHVDGHQHVHVIPALSETISFVLQRNGVTSVRIPAEEEEESVFDGAVQQIDRLGDFLSQVSRDASISRETYQRRGIESSERFVGLRLMGNQLSLGRLLTNLQAVVQREREQRKGNNKECCDNSMVIEWMVHPGFLSLGYGDDFSQSMEREHEKDFLQMREVVDFFVDQETKGVDEGKEIFRIGSWSVIKDRHRTTKR